MIPPLLTVQLLNSDKKLASEINKLQHAVAEGSALAKRLADRVKVVDGGTGM